MAKETVLITGASSGIGLELARLFAADGSDLILIARREASLQALADEMAASHGIAATVMAEDLSDPSAPGRITDTLAADSVEVDVLVNNAGFGLRGPAADLDLQRQLDMLQVNVTALTHLTRLLLPPMVARRRGGVLNVASTAAFQPGPHMAVYYATKAYVLSFSEALTEELGGTGVTVSCLAPGPTATEFADTADMRDTLLFRSGTQGADVVAKVGYDGFRRGKAMVIPGLKNRLIALSVRFSPRPLVRKIVKALQA